MSQATLLACNTQLTASVAAFPVIGRFLTGSAAPGAGLGLVGDVYLRTSTSTIYGPKTTSGWGSGSVITGQPGADGADGKTVLNGTGAPASGTGANGDFYGPKAAGAWSDGVNLIGGS
jgi:hypothetical protein